LTELTCWPLDNTEYTACALGAAYAARSRGILKSDHFAATVSADGHSVIISPGVGCIHVNSFWSAFPLLTMDTSLELEDADGTFERWDAVALTYDKNLNIAGVQIRKGVASDSPALPPLRRDDDYDEIYLYKLRRQRGATKLTAADITDLRLDPTCCGLMRDTLDHIDTSVMQAQYTALLAVLEQELADLNAGTGAMLKAVYDTNGNGRCDKADEAANGLWRYAATLKVDGWIGNAVDGYSQTVPCSPMDGGPEVTADTVLGHTEVVAGSDLAANAHLSAQAAKVNTGLCTTGAGTVTCLVARKPDCDLPLTWLARSSGAPADLPPAGYVEVEQDPTVPAWAKAAAPPTAQEIGALAADDVTAITDEEVLALFEGGDPV